jgi:hypothetical protein
VEDGVAVAEGAALAVLAGEADGFALEDEGAEGEGLGETPVDRAAALVCGDRASRKRLIFGLGLKPSGRVVRPRTTRSISSVDTPVGDLLEVEVGLEDGGGAGEFFRFGGGGAFGGLGGFGCLGLFEVLFEGVGILGLDGLGLGLGDGAFGDELAGEDGGDRRVGGDLFVEERLGEGGLVGLVVAVLAVAVHVDDDVALELDAELEGEAGEVADGLGVVAVHVEDRGLDHLGDIGAVAGGARVVGLGGEADLVVDDDVQGAAGR